MNKNPKLGQFGLGMRLPAPGPCLAKAQLLPAVASFQVSPMEGRGGGGGGGGTKILAPHAWLEQHLSSCGKESTPQTCNLSSFIPHRYSIQNRSVVLTSMDMHAMAHACF